MKHDYGWKGKTFTTKDLPDATQKRCEADKDLRAHYEAELADQTLRYEIVAYDYDDLDEDGRPRPYIAEEIDERAMRRLSERARTLARMMLRQPPEVRAELLAAFKATGELLYPWPLKGQKGFKPPK